MLLNLIAWSGIYLGNGIINNIGECSCLGYSAVIYKACSGNMFVICMNNKDIGYSVSQTWNCWHNIMLVRQCCWSSYRSYFLEVVITCWSLNNSYVDSILLNVNSIILVFESTSIAKGKGISFYHGKIVYFNGIFAWSYCDISLCR